MIAPAIWVLASAALLFITAGLAYASHGAYLSEGWQPTAGYFVLHLGYLLSGSGLVYWVWRSGRVDSP